MNVLCELMKIKESKGAQFAIRAEYNFQSINDFNNVINYNYINLSCKKGKY